MMESVQEDNQLKKPVLPGQSRVQSNEPSAIPGKGGELTEEEKKTNDGHPGKDLRNFPKDDRITEKDVDPHA